MPTANLPALVATLLAELELEARWVAELVVLPDRIAALHLELGDEWRHTPLEQLADHMHSTVWEQTPITRALALDLVGELELNPDVVRSVRLSSTAGIVAELAWPAPVRVELAP